MVLSEACKITALDLNKGITEGNTGYWKEAEKQDKLMEMFLSIVHNSHVKML